jgi:phage tail sheath protein FI
MVAVTVSYPGVYIEEIPSAVRTISGVSTSIAAFAGWAPKGPDTRAVLCLSWADYDRIFGGLDARGYLGYAVSQFFGNGGTQCYVIRLTGAGDVAATAVVDGLEVVATGPGTWANAYQLVTKPRADDATRFRLDVVVKATGAIAESYMNLSLDAADSRYVKAVLADESQIISVTKADTTKPVTAKTQDLAGGADGPVLLPSDAAFGTALMGDGVSTGVFYLDRVDLFNLLNVPGYVNPTNLGKLEKFCRGKRALLLVDSDKGTSVDGAAMTGAPDSSLTGDDGINAAFYYPWLLAPDPQQEGRVRPFPPCGSVAGVYARTDSARGVWKAPAGTDASLTGVTGVVKAMTDAENGVLNPLAVNCIRKFPVYGTIVWGARTLRGNDEIGSEWKYVPVRRMALYIEESLYRGLKWVVFEPNDEPLWAQIRLNVGAFMQDLFRQGAFQGSTPKEAYFVKCDKDTTTQSDINRGIVNIEVGFAPLKPAEFVVIKIQQMAGQLAV